MWCVKWERHRRLYRNFDGHLGVLHCQICHFARQLCNTTTVPFKSEMEISTVRVRVRVRLSLRVRMRVRLRVRLRVRDGEGGGAATKSFFALKEGRIACHPTCSSKNPITRLRLYLVNDKNPSSSFLLVLCSRMGRKSIPAPMVTASEQQSLP